MEKINKVALFIDAENIGSEFADDIMNAVKRYGEPTVKRIYGGSKTKPISDWREKAGEYGILSAIRYVYTAKKNASDIALAVDVMNTLHERDVDVFVIASSDSDFTALAHELRERGKKVIGIGLKSANKTYRSALSEPYIELDTELVPVKAESNQPIMSAEDIAKQNLDIFTKEVIKEIDEIINKHGSEALMATLGNRINKNEVIKALNIYDKPRDGNLTDFLLKIDKIATLYDKKGKKTDTALIRKQSAKKPGEMIVKAQSVTESTRQNVSVHGEQHPKNSAEQAKQTPVPVGNNHGKNHKKDKKKEKQSV